MDGTYAYRSFFFGSIVVFATEIGWGRTRHPTIATRPAYAVQDGTRTTSFLADPAQRTDFWDPIKYIPFLNASGDSYASFGGQVRDRYEYYNRKYLGSGPQIRDGYNDTRLTENVDLRSVLSCAYCSRR